MSLIKKIHQRNQRKIFKVGFRQFLEKYPFLSNNFINYWVKELGDNYIPETLGTYEWKDQPFEYNFSNLNCWISVDKITSLIEKYDFETKQLKIRNFHHHEQRRIVKPSSTTIWYKKSNHPKFKDNPIYVLASNFNSHTENIVVDGNHRVSYYIQQGIPKISAVILTDEILQEHNLFVSNYSKSVHAFLTAFFQLYYSQNHEQ